MLHSQKYDLNWGLQQLREVWTKNFKTSPDEEEDVEVDHLEGGLVEKPIPYISNDNFSQEGIFDYWNDHLSGHTHVKRNSERTLMSLGCEDSSMVTLDLESG